MLLFLLLLFSFSIDASAQPRRLMLALQVLFFLDLSLLTLARRNRRLTLARLHLLPWVGLQIDLLLLILLFSSCIEEFYREGLDNIAHLQYCVRDFTEKVCNCVRDFTECREGFQREQSGILLIEIQNFGENEEK
jgi:hypothetical protein